MMMNENNELLEDIIQNSVIDDENINVNIDKYENEYLEFAKKKLKEKELI